MTTSNLMH